MYNSYVSNVNIDNVANSFNQGAQQIEDSMESMITKIQSSANPSQADLMQLQALTVKWQGLIQSESAVMKAVGDTMKAITQAIGS